MKKRQTVLVVDGGGRGSVLVDKYGQSEYVGKIIAVPGNDLMQINCEKPVKTYPLLKTTSTTEILAICKKEKVDLVDVAQDNAVAVGLVDLLTKNGVSTVGPTKLAGQIEWDKAWARDFGKKYALPQPFYKICKSPEEGISFIKSQADKPWFIKASFLAEGKGALPAKNSSEAIARISEMARFGAAGKVFLVEKWLTNEDGTNGEEFSVFAFCDGDNYKIVGSAQDHKRVYNFDEGGNTGGMGCSSPPLVLTDKLLQTVKKEILDKTIAGLYKEERIYKGVLYLGGMVVKRKTKLSPYVIEFNARWGDPEAQVVLPGIINDLFEVNMTLINGSIRRLNLKLDNKARVVVTGATRGYPDDYQSLKGKQIYGLDEIQEIEGVKLYGAGVKKEGTKYYAAGGRLFYIVGEGTNVIEARTRAYGAMSQIFIEGNNLHYRTDIGWRDVERLTQ